MTRVIHCLLSFVTTACLSTGIHFLLPKSGALLTANPEPVRSTALPVFVATPIIEPSPGGYSLISQEAIVRFPQFGNVRVRAREEFKSLKLEFIDPKSEREVHTSYLGNYDWSWDNPDWNPKLRFKVISIKGLPDPLVVAIAMNPGVSDSGWEAVAVGVVNGRLEQLNYEALETSNEGGFYFGDLGHGLGLGAAQWNFVWGEDECHPPPHKYEVKLFKWNGRRFEWEKVLRTRRRYNSSQKALLAYGFHFVNARNLVPEWAGINGLAEE